MPKSKENTAIEEKRRGLVPPQKKFYFPRRTIMAEFTPNVERIRAKGIWIVRGRLPRGARKELMAGVRAGHLGHLKKDGLKPEIFYNPNYYYSALERQEREAKFAIECIKKLCGSPHEI